MAITFPSGLDTLTNPTAADNLDSPDHAGQHSDSNDGIEALQVKVGIDNSAATASLDYLLKNTSSANPGHKHTLANGATDVTATYAELNFVDGVTSAIQDQLDAKGDMSDLVDDTTPQLGGNLDMNSNNIEGITPTEMGYLSGVSSALQTQINAKGVGDALTAIPLSQFASTTSTQLRGLMSDETGTGLLVFATSPTLVTPLLGTPTSGVLTNCTGIASGLEAGAVEGTGVKSTGEGGGSKYLREDGDGTSSWQAVAGGGDVSKVGTPADSQVGVWTGDGTIEGTAGLTYDGSNLLLTGDIGITGTRITKGWFTDLEVTNAIAGDITGNSATVTTITGLAPDTATTQATQPNITSLGTLTTLTVDDITINGGTISTAANDDIIITPGGTGQIEMGNAGAGVGLGLVTMDIDRRNLLVIAAHGTNVESGINTYNSNGTQASPTATQSGDILYFMGARGYGATGYGTGSKIAILFTATQNHTDAAMGNEMTFETTPNASVTRAVQMHLDDGGLSLTTGNTYQINDVDVLSATVLGSSVITSSLTTVGTIGTGTWEATDVGLAHGGTGASNAGDARTNLGLVIGTDVLANIVEDTSPQLGGMLDVNGNSIGDGTLELLSFSETGSAVNEFTIANAATGNGPELQATGGDANIDIELKPKGTGIVKGELKRFMVQLLDSATDQTTDTTIQGDFRISNKAITIKAVGAYVDTAGVTGTCTVDINEAGSTILSTKITIDTTEKSSETAATPPVISDSAIAADAIITFDIDAIHSGTAAKGLKVWIDYIYA